MLKRVTSLGKRRPGSEWTKWTRGWTPSSRWCETGSNAQSNVQDLLGGSSTSLLVLSPRATEALAQVLLKLYENELIFSVMNSWSRAKRWGKAPYSTGRVGSESNTQLLCISWRLLVLVYVWNSRQSRRASHSVNIAEPRSSPRKYLASSRESHF